MAITDRRALGARTVEAWDRWLDELAGAGVDALQVREKDLDDRALVELVRHVRRRLPDAVTVLVNGRLDVALAAGADGVHLPAAGLPAEALRRWARSRGADPLVGRSTHTPEAVAAARAEGVDYVLFGPVFDTPSKRRYGPPPGPQALSRASRSGVPILALGGLDADRLSAAAEAGAAGAAGIRVFLDPQARDRFVRTGRALFGEIASDEGNRPDVSPVVDSRDEPTP
jgi:thiamine-phosphate pyrophosphorylase